MLVSSILDILGNMCVHVLAEVRRGVLVLHCLYGLFKQDITCYLRGDVASFSVYPHTEIGISLFIPRIGVFYHKRGF